jgi:hypothetical protein
LLARFVLAVSLLSAVCGALPAAALLEIENARTTSHVAVPGTGTYFVPAPGLSPATSFVGFESKERKIEVIVVNIAGPFDEISKAFDEDSFKSMGMELKSRGDMVVNGAHAVLFKVFHPDGGVGWGKWIMLMENGGETLEVNAMFVSGDSQAALDLEAMLKGVYVDKPAASVEPGEKEEPGEPSEPLEGPASADAVPAPPVSADAAASADRPEESAPKSPDKNSPPTEEGPAVASKDTAPHDGTVSFDNPVSFDKPDERETGEVSPDVSAPPTPPDVEARPGSGDLPETRTRVRIITEDGIISIDPPASEDSKPEAENEGAVSRDDSAER